MNVEIDADEEILKALKELDGVSAADLVYGVYDIVVTLEAKTLDEIKDIVTWKIRRLEKVRSTITCVAV